MSSSASGSEPTDGDTCDNLAAILRMPAQPNLATVGVCKQATENQQTTKGRWAGSHHDGGDDREPSSNAEDEEPSQALGKGRRAAEERA